MKIMIWNAAKGGMRSVVEAYISDGFVAKHDIKLIHSYADAGVVARQILFVGALFKFLWTMVSNKVELVHIHGAMRGSFFRKSIFVCASKIFRVPVVYHLHGSEMKEFYASLGALGKRYVRWVFESSSCAITLSESWKHWVKNIAPKANAVVVPNYVKIPAASKIQSESVSISFLGLIGKRKGAFDLIAAMEQVHMVHPNVVLTIGGNGNQSEAEILVKSLGLEKVVKFAGWVGPEERANMLRKSDIFVLPSYNEGLPMSILEAMSYNVAVITTRVGGIPELIENGTNGLLVNAGDVRGLAQSINKLVENEGLKKSIANAGFKTVSSQYSDNVVLPMLDEIYRKNSLIISRNI